MPRGFRFPLLVAVVGLTVLIGFGEVRARESIAGENPAEALRKRFQSAKAALASGDLGAAEKNYLLTISLGLHQLGKIAISEQQFERATAYLDEAVTLREDDLALKVDDAVAWFQRGDTQKAAQVLQTVLKVEPRNARAHNVLGRLYLFEGYASGAADELEKAAGLEGDFETAYFLGIALLQGKKTAEASGLFVKLQASAGESAALHVLFGRAYTVTQFPERAVEEFRKAIKLDPKYPRAHALLGYATLEFYGETSYPQAKELFQQELQLQPDDYLSLVLLGICDTSLRDYQSAESVLLRAIRLRPDGASPYLYLGETYTAAGRFPPAVEALRKYTALARAPQESNRSISRAYFLLGQDLLRLGGNGDEARQALAQSQQLREAQFKYDQTHMFVTAEEQRQGSGFDSVADARSLSSDRMAGVLGAGAVEREGGASGLAQAGLPVGTVPGTEKQKKPTDESSAVTHYRAFAAEVLASSYNDLGVMRAQTQNFAKAAGWFKKAHEWKAQLPGLDRNLGLAAYKAENYEEAIPALERQIAAHADDQFARQILALSYFARDKFASVVDVLGPLRQHAPADPAVLFAWGSSLVKLRQSALAERIFQLMVQQNDLNPGVHLLLGQAYAQEKNYADALRELDTAIKLDEKLTDAHYYAGLVYLHQSDFANAIREFHAELALRPEEPIATYHLAFALLSQGQTEDAIDLFRNVIRVRPDYELAYLELGRALLQHGDVPEAIANLEKARSLNPDRDLTYFQLSQAYRRGGRTQEAEQALTRYKKMIEESRQKRRQSLEMDAP